MTAPTEQSASTNTVGARSQLLNPHNVHTAGSRKRVSAAATEDLIWSLARPVEPVFDVRHREATERNSPMALWWAVPTFAGVEAWPGRGWLVEAADGSIQFVHDVTARLAPGTVRDGRFADPEPVPHGASTSRRRTPANTAAPAPYWQQREPVQRRSAARAAELLVSLLDERQRVEFAASGTFWVHGPFGSIRLGRAYDLSHRPPRSHRIERRLCVVTNAHRQIPPADEWTSMLLTLHHDPDRFFAVANAAPIAAPRGLPRRALDDSVRGGRVLDAAYLCAAAGGVPAAWVWASVILRRHARLHPPTTGRFLAQHAPVLARAARAARRVDATTLDEWIAAAPTFRGHTGPAAEDLAGSLVA